MAQSALRWGRILLGGFLAELALIGSVIPVYAAGGSESVVTIIAVAGSFLVFLPIAWWLGRPLDRPVLHGALMGLAAAVIYITISVVSQIVDPNAPAAPFIYYVGHALKLAGGAAGGWLAQRTSEKAVRPVVRAS